MVYLLCFDKKYKHAKHYIGFASSEKNLLRRLEHHKTGRGAKLLKAVSNQGIDFQVAHIWPKGDRNFERHLKNKKNAALLCPICREAKKKELAEKRRKVKEIKQMEEIPNATSGSNASPSRWQKIQSFVGKLWPFSKTKNLQ